MLPDEYNIYLRLQDVSLGKALCGTRIPDEFWLGITTLGSREWLMMLLVRICASRIQGTKSTFLSPVLLSILCFIIIYFTSRCLLYFRISPFSYAFFFSFFIAFLLPLSLTFFLLWIRTSTLSRSWDICFNAFMFCVCDMPDLRVAQLDSWKVATAIKCISNRTHASRASAIFEITGLVILMGFLCDPSRCLSVDYVQSYMECAVSYVTQALVPEDLENEPGANYHELTCEGKSRCHSDQHTDDKWRVTRVYEDQYRQSDLYYALNPIDT